MSILSKVTLGFVSVAALCFAYMAMRALKTHQAWRTHVQAHEKAITAAEAKIIPVLEGDPGEGKPSLGQLKVALDAAIFGRGRAWMDASPRFDAASGNVVATIDQPQPHQVQPDMVLHAFQGLDDAATGRYIGEFKVAAVDGNNITLTYTYPMSAAKRNLFQQARAPWALYEVVPADTNDLFANMNEQDIQALLPKPPQKLPGEANDDFQARQLEHKQLVDEYLRDNKPINPDEPPPNDRIQVMVKFVKSESDLNQEAKNSLRAIDFGENLVKSGVVMKVDLKTAEELVRLELVQEVERRYQRKLRDYSFILREYNRRLPVLEDQIANLQRDLDYMVEANQEADKHLADSRKQEAAMKQELALVTTEKNVVNQYRDTLAERLDKLNAQIAKLQEDNQRLAAQLAQRQLEAVEGTKRSAALAAPAR